MTRKLDHHAAFWLALTLSLTAAGFALVPVSKSPWVVVSTGRWD